MKRSIKDAAKAKTKTKRRTRVGTRVSAVAKIFKIAKLMFKVAIAADTARRVLASEERRDALRRFGQRVQTAAQH